MKIRMDDTKKINLEFEECMKLVHWLRLKDIKFCHINNEVYTKSWKQKSRIKAMGSAQGFPDYLLIVNSRLIAIEMKRLKGGIVSTAQKEWIKQLNSVSIPARVCNGFDEAKIFVEEIENEAR